MTVSSLKLCIALISLCAISGCAAKKPVQAPVPNAPPPYFKNCEPITDASAEPGQQFWYCSSVDHRLWKIITQEVKEK